MKITTILSWRNQRMIKMEVKDTKRILESQLNEIFARLHIIDEEIKRIDHRFHRLNEEIEKQGILIMYNWNGKS